MVSSRSIETSMEPLICFACKRREDPYDTFYRCGGCQTVYYCGPECQRKDWKGHKAVCKAAQENYVFLIRLLAKKAAHGDHEAMFSLGCYYEHGVGVAKDATQAVIWYRHAVDAGHTEALYSLAYCYQRGEGVAKDAYQAVTWYRRAADAGHTKALYNLAVCYQRGEGVAKDATQAVTWYRRAADAGDAEAQFTLAGCYAEGRGVEADDVQALSWLQRAAKAGHAHALITVREIFDTATPGCDAVHAPTC